ncbi:AGAP003963-PA [Anopheles gambiae str. PEST]|uniref:AGAP003963-PA n=1 Tax=Anopheles gambiae TaxID=7165 RepID=A7UV02_ANOGA|nr:AGAP003963-PA [Anopheles gambiae str. PEST]
MEDYGPALSTPCQPNQEPANVEQPVYAQLMPAAVMAVAAYSYEHPSEVGPVPNLVTAVPVIETTHPTAICVLDSGPISASETPYPLDNNPPSLQTHSSPSASNGPSTDLPADVQPSTQALYSVAETTACNGVSLPAGGSRIDAPTMMDSSVTESSAFISDSTSGLHNPVMDVSNDRRPTKATDENSPSEPSESSDRFDNETISKNRTENDGDSAMKVQEANNEKLQCESKDGPTQQQEQPTIETQSTPTADEEELVESHHDEDENSSDSVISDEDTENSPNVSSLFKNVVLVQAHTLAAEETDPEEPVTSPAALDETEVDTDPIVTSSVEDIGREEESEADEMVLPAGLFIDETEDVPNGEVMEGVAVGQMGQIVALDAPIIDSNDEYDPHNGIDDGEGSKGRSIKQHTSQKCQMRKRNRIAIAEKDRLNDEEKKSKRYKEYRKTSDDPFGSCSNSSSEDVPNDIYFGASDRVYTVSTKLHWQHQKQKGRKHQSRAKVSTDRDDDGVESSDNEEEEWVRRKAKKAEEIARLKLPAYQQQQLQQLVLKKHPKRDRFYDRSQDIPNDIYFGNGSIRSVHRMKEYLKMAGFRHMRYQKLWQGCETNQDRAEAILRFLQEHGLQGEPTDEKCRELRKQIQLQKEVEVLDTSVIIGSGEGRVTRQRAKKVSESSTTEPVVSNLPEQHLQSKEEKEIQTQPTNCETIEQESQCEQPSSEQQPQQQEQEEQVAHVPSEQCEEPTLPIEE